MSIVDNLYSEYNEIIAFLSQSNQPSLVSDTSKYFKKVILLSSASYFEHEIQNILVQFVKISTNDNLRVINFLKKKAIGQNYHTFFAWGEKNDHSKPGKNANVFFSMFGDDFKLVVQEEIKCNEELDKSIKSFLEIGHLRNILVHSNFAAYNLDNKTPEEIYAMHNNSIMFIDYIKERLQ
jgi:hypothetical protein